MANIASAKKRIRRNNKRAVINNARRTRVRTFIKKVEATITESNVADAENAYKTAQPELMRAVAKGVFDKKSASRKLSRLSQHIKTLKQRA